MNALENQIKEMYHKAFYDIIDETIASNSPNYEWIVNLYAEKTYILLLIMVI